MNLMNSFNKALKYIENVLDREIDEERIAHLSGYSYAMFSRLFSILTEMTLSEYIRGRRLTEAALLLRETKTKVIDIALQFGYESPDSFGAAFKNFHGFTPSEVRHGKPYKLVSPIQLTLGVKGGRSMTVTIQKKEAFVVAGINKENVTSAQCPGIWEELYSSFSHEELSHLGEGQSVGVCHDVETSDVINYLAGYIVTDVDKAKDMDLDILEIKENDYAVVQLQGSVPDCIHQGWKYAMEVFFPEHGYNHSGDPDFEYYSEGDMDNDEYQMELWIPVVKA